MPSPVSPAKPPRKHRIGLTAPESPLAREIRSTFHRHQFPVSRFVPLGKPDDEGRLSEIDGEAAFLETPRRETIGDLDFLILAGSDSDALAASLARDNDVPCHDATAIPVGAEGCLELLAAVSPAPAAAAFTLLLPAAEEADPGIRELFAQTGDALNMHTTTAKVFSGRLAFNLLRDASTQALERAIASELAGKSGEVRSITVVCARAAIFHGYAGAAALRFSTPAEVRKAHQALGRAAGLSVGRRPGHATPAEASESEKILLDPPSASGDTLTVWFAFDGLSLAARRAFAAARSRLA